MVGVARNWIVRQLSIGEFDSQRHVWCKATGMAFKIAVLALFMNVVGHLVFFKFDLLPYTLASGLVAAAVITPIIAFSFSLVVYAVLGFAIHDLGVSRTELERLSQTDMLSGLSNRRAFQDAFDRCDREKTMVVFDIDHFKTVNDKYGHTTGDVVIAKVADVILDVFGDRGMCARIGGEEYAVFSGDISFADFAVLAELARSRVGSMLTHVDDDGFTVTISGGVARARPDQQFGEIFSRADKALYTAKTGGRDRIVLSYETEEPEAEQAAVAAN